MGLVSVVLGCALVAMLAVVLPSVESFLLARQQGQTGFVGHVALLPYSSMYTLEHQVCIGIPAHSIGEVEAEDVAMCERIAYEVDPDVAVSCEVLPMSGPANHFPTAGLSELANRLELCGGDWMDVVLVSKGWRTEVHHKTRLLLEEGSFRWETIE